MISFDQVLLLEQKVESAVAKIEQLNAENAALRSKCAELSNALNAKSEQFSSFQSDQSKIEEGILKALSRLNAVENVVLQASGAAQASLNPAPVAQPVSSAVPHGDSVTQQSSQVASEPVPQPKTEQVAGPVTQNEPVAPVQPAVPNQVQNPEPSFDSMNVSEHVQNASESSVQSESDDSSSTLAPDIDFEFGESDSSVAQPADSNVNNAQSAGVAQQEPDLNQQSDSSQPLFDIF